MAMCEPFVLRKGTKKIINPIEDDSITQNHVSFQSIYRAIAPNARLEMNRKIISAFLQFRSPLEIPTKVSSFGSRGLQYIPART